ncbi:immunity 52 family protein [Myxococcus faecalis]|uniref:immunity 52 family protein n=1 Tax=Myxococcus faecalis TaxID=3115646 RepID=UPI0038D1B209
MTVKPVSMTYPETYFAGAYWGARKETPEECARRTADFLNLLSSCDPVLAQWYKPARSLKDARRHSLMPPDLPTLTEMFRRGVNRERGGPAIERLGYSFWFGNGESGADSADLRVTCGDYSGANPNSCVLPLPKKGPSVERILTAPVLTSVVRSMVRPWEPDWAFATSDSYAAAHQEADSAPFSLGWVTYLSNHLGRVPPLPAPVRIEPVEDKGTLIVLTPERFTASNPDHVALAERVRELLDRAGLLKPLQVQP